MLVPGSLTFLVNRAIVFSISAIINAKDKDSARAVVLDYLYFLMVALNSWVSNYVECFDFEAIVCPVVVDPTRDSPPSG